jgi:sarcosine oxidase, subunit alpha
VSGIDFEGRQIAIADGDTIASALYRAGLRVFSRSFKYHRRRGLYCLSGECPNCMVSVDGAPCVRACVTPASPGQRVARSSGWPSTDRDVLAVFDRMHRLLPAGFYYKTLIRPPWLWPRVEPWVRRIAGLGTIQADAQREHRETRHLHPDLLVVGAGVAGLSAALAGAEAGRTVVVCDEDGIGARLAPGSTASRVAELAATARASELITIFERTPAIGLYEGPLAVLNGSEFLQLIHPRSIVVATGAIDQHGVFPGNDLPGVFLARGAARLAGVHGVAPGRRAVLVGTGHELDEHAAALAAAGTEVSVLGDVEIVEVRGPRTVSAVVVRSAGVEQTHPCDVVVLGTGLAPRDELLRQGAGLPVRGAGDAVAPGCTLEEAERSGRGALDDQPAAESVTPALPTAPTEGIVCLCEDVTVAELGTAWDEGFRSTEIVKRYTTITMGPCHGALCHRHLRAFVNGRSGATGPGSLPTTSRPPVRGITLEQVSAGEGHPIDQQTALHRRHRELGATMEAVGNWWRPAHYGAVLDEYWAVRKAVSVMDVGTLGKYLVAGPDATEVLDRLYPCHVRDLTPGRFRYALTLGEHGYVVDDGLICAREDGSWYITFTSSGAAAAEPMIRDWIETWGLEAHLVNVTAAWGAINVAGPDARTLLARLSDEGTFDPGTLPYLRHARVTVGGVDCRAIRLGFVGELSYELHHPASQSVVLWDKLLEAGADLGIRPHGMEALRLLRLEKGHLLIGQDTDFDATPAKVGMSWAVKDDKRSFVGQSALRRIAGVESERKLIALTFEGTAPPEGSALMMGDEYVGYLTSSRYSPVLERGVALGWISRVAGEFPGRVEAGGVEGQLATGPFYDAEGVRLRA